MSIKKEVYYYDCYFELYHFLNLDSSKKVIEQIEEAIRNNNNEYLPILLRTNIKLLDKFEDKEEKANNDPQQLYWIRYYKRMFDKYVNLYKNTSIWFRLVDKLDEQYNEKVEASKAYFKENYDKGLYKISTAIEHIEFALRTQKENVLLNRSSGHGIHITPTLFHDELKCANTILSINTEEDETKYKFPELIDFNDVTFRILLIDDKYQKTDIEIPKGELIKILMEGDVLEPFVNNTNNIRYKDLAKRIALETIESMKSWINSQDNLNDNKDVNNNQQQYDPRNELVKILDNIKKIVSANDIVDEINILKQKVQEKCIVKERVDGLMSYLEKREKKIKNDYYIAERLIWKEECIENYFYTAVEEKRKEYDNAEHFDISNKKTSHNVQIIQVTNLADAITLLADENIRFDLILLDYLLGSKDKGNNNDDRQLSTDFFIWFQDKEGEKEEVNYLRRELCEIKNKEKGQSAKCPLANNTQNNNAQTNKCSSCKEYQFILKENKTLRQRIKSNRGPLRKLWIFPITAFNETLIDDLTRNNVRLIDYYWHISKGADPITTPYLFLRMLNNFLYLQLESSVFMEHEIKEFLKKSIQRLDKVERSEDFIAMMGSDYTEFVQNFMNRSIIYRDKINNSLFANYIWENFYSNEKYKNEHILVNYIHRFYHRCAFGGNSEYRKMILFWRDMKLFIENNFPDWVNDNELNLETYYSKLNQVYPK